MFFSNYCNKLYLSNYSYNFAKVLAELKNIVENNGGTVKEQQRGVAINRYYIDKKQELAEKIERLQAVDHKSEFTLKVLANCKQELAKIENMPQKEFETDNLTYICFYIDGFYYYFQGDENMFFEWQFIKTPIINGNKSCDACLNRFPREAWFIDTLCNIDCNETEQREIAYIIFNTLMGSKESAKIIDKKRVRVANLYDNGYHYETIKEKERFSKVDF